MKKPILLLILILLISSIVQGQDKDVKKVFVDLNSEFIKINNPYKKLTKQFDSLKSLISSDSSNNDALFKSLKSMLPKMPPYVKKLDSIYNLTKAQRLYYIDNEKHNRDSIKKYIDSIWAKDVFKYKPKVLKNKKESSTKRLFYTYFDKNTVIADSVLNKSTTENKILRDVLSQKSETYFGDISVPKQDQKFYFYKYIKNSKNSKLIKKGTDKKTGEPTKYKKKIKKEKQEEKYVVDSVFLFKNKEKKYSQRYIPTSESYQFKKIDIEIKDGEFSDIKVYVEYEGSLHIFSNRQDVALLNFSSVAKRNYLSYKQSVIGSKKFDLKRMDSLYIRLGDVMVYDYKIGNHYVPNNLTIELPQNDINDSATNIKSSATYKIKQKTDLNKIVELRTYSDFLALFGNSSNGLVQVEGNARFYVFPFPMRFFWNSQFELFSSLSPHVNYSNFEKNTRYVTFYKNKTGQDSVSALNLVQKRYLTMGVEGNLLKIKHKDLPVEFSIYGFVNYQLSRANFGDDSVPIEKDIKALSLGGGLELSANRLNNFGFNYRFELSWYNYRDFNDIENFITPQKLLFVIRNEAEVSYHPTLSPNSAIFVRLITFNDSRGGTNYNDAFYQFQFGYKFSIGNRKIQ